MDQGIVAKALSVNPGVDLRPYETATTIGSALDGDTQEELTRLPQPRTAIVRETALADLTRNLLAPVSNGGSLAYTECIDAVELVAILK